MPDKAIFQHTKFIMKTLIFMFLPHFSAHASYTPKSS